MSDHSDYAPSSASIWLNCPASVHLSPLYKEDDTAASNLGTIAHGILEDCVLFGTEPQHPDMEIVEGVELAMAFVSDTLLRYPGVTLYAEKRLSVANTPLWGTVDLVAVGTNILHISDYKHGWVPVAVDKNDQMQSYLKGAIEEFGPRDKYLISIIQPRYHHRDGPIRTYQVTHEDLTRYDTRLEWALANPGEFRPGRHCRYCKARGACKALAGWLIPRLNTMMDYEITDKHTFDNDLLAKMLDFLDMVPGYISAVRQEAYKRALQDRRIGGYKIVKGKAERKVEDEEYIRAKYGEWGIPGEALYDQSFVSPLTIENQLKARFKSAGRGKWKEHYDQLSPAITISYGGLSLVRDTDGRPQFNKGDEFGELPAIDGEVIL